MRGSFREFIPFEEIDEDVTGSWPYGAVSEKTMDRLHDSLDRVLARRRALTPEQQQREELYTEALETWLEDHPDGDPDEFAQTYWQEA